MQQGTVVLYGDTILAECSSDWTYQLHYWCNNSWGTASTFLHLYFTSHPLPCQLCIFTTLTHSTVHHISLAGSNYKLKSV